MQENYHNVKMIWDKLNMEAVKFYVATDLKLANIMFGQQKHSEFFVSKTTVILNWYTVK